MWESIKDIVTSGGGEDTYLKFNAGTPDGGTGFWSNYKSIILAKTA